MSKNKLDQKNSLTKMVRWSSTPVKTTWSIPTGPKLSFIPNETTTACLGWPLLHWL